MKKNITKQILSGLILSDSFISKLHNKITPQDFDNKPAQIIVKWCFDFFVKYNKAPRQHIEDMLEDEESKYSEEDLELVRILLETLDFELSEGFESELNLDFILDRTQEEFQKKSLEQLVETIQNHIELATPQALQEAVKLVQNYSQLELTTQNGFDLLSNIDKVNETFEYENKPLIQFPGEFGKMVNPFLSRESFIAIFGPEKRGKSWVLMEFAFRAYTQKRNVAYFEAGDNSERQLLRRFYSRFSATPMYKHQCGVIQVPKEIQYMGNDVYDITYKSIIANEPLSSAHALEGLKRWKNKVRSHNKIKISTHINTTLTPSMIRSQLNHWMKEEGFIPDVLVIDYVDIMATDSTQGEYRHQVNDIWKRLRALSQEFHLCLITGTQADALSYKTKTLSMDNFSEDKRKNAHVTGMLGLNQTPDEKLQNIMRLNWVVLREGEYSPNSTVAIGTCFPLGRFYCADCKVEAIT